MALRKIGTGRDSALITTGEASSGWARWETYPMWAKFAAWNRLELPPGRYRAEPLDGTIVAYIDGASAGSSDTVTVWEGNVALYGYGQARMIITRLA